MVSGPVTSDISSVNQNVPPALRPKENVAILGCGILGSLIVKGLQTPEGQQVYEVTATHRSEQRAVEISRTLGVPCLVDNRDACESASIIVFAVRPQSMAGVLELVSHSIKPGTLCITLAAGLPLSFYEERLSRGTPIIRILPTPLMAIRRGYVALCANEQAGASYVERAKHLFSFLCLEAIQVPETDLDLFAAINGSGSALLYLLVDAMLSVERCKGEVSFPARRVIAGMLDGVSHMLMESSKSPRELCDQICTPGGMTAAGVEVWKENDLSGAITNVMEVVLRRAREMREGK